MAPDHPRQCFVGWNRCQEEILERLEHELELIAGPDCSAPDACDSCGVDHAAETGPLGQMATLESSAQPALDVNHGLFELGWKDLDRLVSWLMANDAHYKRKENALFPLLERHGISAPTQVMWGVQDDIRAQLKAVRVALDTRDGQAFVRRVLPLITAIRELIYKEERILYPLSLEKLDAVDWAMFAKSWEDASFLGHRV